MSITTGCYEVQVRLLLSSCNTYLPGVDYVPGTTLVLGTKDGRVLEPQMLPVDRRQTLFHLLKHGQDTEVHPV